MGFYVIIRGPLGIGKSTVSARLATEIRGEHIFIDQILDEHNLWDSGRASEFLRANRFAAELSGPLLANGTPVIFDGNFYWKSVLADLLGRLDYPHVVFTLRAPLGVCIDRDRGRTQPYGASAAKAVFSKSTRFDYGRVVDATGSVDDILREVRSHLPRGASRHAAPKLVRRSA
jgi:predicted kinase